MLDSVTVTLKSPDQTFSKKFPIASLEVITLSHDDPMLKLMVEDAQAACKEQADEITIKVCFNW